MSSSAEAQREREVKRYLHSWEVAQGSSLNVALNVDSIAKATLHSTGYKPQASPDKALTAFAQLAVLKLDVKRAMVSLIDENTQIILAEATRNLRLGNLTAASTAGQASGNSASDNDLWLGASILSRPEAVCEHCFINTYTATDTDGSSHKAVGLVVPNCRDDPRFQNRDYVVCEPGVRFYAGVPIISRNGHMIGAYAVSDERPRFGLTADELKFMQGVSEAVMDHLEWARDRVDRFKGERIVRGLAAFIEGCSTVSDDLAKDEMKKSSSTLRPPEMTVSASRRHLTRSGSYSRTFTTNAASGTSTPPGPEEPAPQPLPLAAAASSQSSPRSRSTLHSKQDGMSKMFLRAAEILRECTLADGVVLFGATTATRQASRVGNSNGANPSSEDDVSLQATSESEGIGNHSSDSDDSPGARPCKILAYSLADMLARADIEQGSALSIGTLESYFATFPKGKAFSFTGEGAGISSEDDSSSDREPSITAIAQQGSGAHAGPRRRKPKMDHKELLKKIPGAKSVIFVPLFDHAEDRLAGGCFLWTSVQGRMMSLDADLSYLRAFCNSIMSEAGRINTQKNEAAKTTFIASMSHELRSPLHGVLGAVEFLKDTSVDTYQSGLINSIYTCGRTLLDTLNHVLDYSKINRLGRMQMRRGAKNKLNNQASDSLESLNMTAVVDLAILVEEVVDSIATGHTFSVISGSTPPEKSLAGKLIGSETKDGESPVSILLDIDPRTSWMVRTQPGAIRRIIMNLFGNSLKYTSSGYVLVSLRGQLNAEGTKVEVVIKVSDTGKGMSDEFQQNRLFVPFSQEDSFQPGTGLGLSIVKQIVDSLGGSLEVKSQQHKGTEVDVRLRLTPSAAEASLQLEDALHLVVEQTRGLKVMLLRDQVDSQTAPQQSPYNQKLNGVFAETCANWFHMDIIEPGAARAEDADIILYSEPPSESSLQRCLADAKRLSLKKRRAPIIITCANAESAVRIAQSQIKLLGSVSEVVEVIAQPCGPRKLGKVLGHCLKRAAELDNLNPGESSVIPSPPPDPSPGPSISAEPLLSPALNAPETPLALPVLGIPQLPRSPLSSPPPLNPATPPLAAATEVHPRAHAPISAVQQTPKRNAPHVLLVDDNPINLQLLVMFMKKCGFSYEGAENGQEAVDKFKAVYLSGRLSTKPFPRGFDFVLMDISMPVMNGLEATKHIRDYEFENEIPATTVIALTGLASADARRDAKNVGVDVFLPKPVRFAELKRLLQNEE